MAGLIAMISVFVVVSIEMFFATRGAGHMHGSEYETLSPSLKIESRQDNGHVRPFHKRQESLRPFRQGRIGPDSPNGVVLHAMAGSHDNIADGAIAPPTSNYATSAVRSNGTSGVDVDVDEHHDLDLEELEPDEDSSHLLSRRSHSIDHHRAHRHHEHELPAPDTAQNAQKMLLQCLLLEAGILFHSVFIGMALSVATGTSFIVLLVAISFHQTFEGLALGSRIAAIPLFGRRSLKPWLMALAYGTTTPFGQAIGLLVHNLYDPASQTGLLMVGFMNAISSGLLLFAGLVELLAEDFLSDRSYEVLKGQRRIEACLAVAGGGALMALVGAWA